ncbi:DUF2812 domain-containing protein [Clostridium folliculivorans]|uniref:DUF2812 domain-containing protein n=1 Tax=Clostridium folliculivorans TaxID=2886038 RepID=A0A9W6DAU6_9CLOT|nr:DUF2812 domain-containing protein [Clostridium folliculivorans]GKU25038.1 hypothetical protein CFOLD11_18640 [Clostridium folliculivorans]GKU31136.1 hypothetical protein CFB3_32430 [Clostridium folliculivorans]
MSGNLKKQAAIRKSNILNGSKETDDLIKIRKSLLFIFNPNKVGQWLEEMEAKGYRLDKINKRGNLFYFTRNEKRKTKYFIDFPNIIDKVYFRTYIKLGWKPMYNTRMIGGKMVIWMRTVDQGDVCSKSEFLNCNMKLPKNVFRVVTANLVNLIILVYFFINLVATVHKNIYRVDMFYIGLNTFFALLAFTFFYLLHGSVAYFIKLKNL